MADIGLLFHHPPGKRGQNPGPLQIQQGVVELGLLELAFRLQVIALRRDEVYGVFQTQQGRTPGQKLPFPLLQARLGDGAGFFQDTQPFELPFGKA